MTKLEQAARQLLEVAEGIQHGTDWNNGTHAKIYRPKFPAAITALREALAEQAEQEPVGYFAYDEEHDIWEELTGPNALGATKLYAAPVRTKDLSDDEIERALDAAKVTELPDGYKSVDLEIARAVIAADREKNK